MASDQVIERTLEETPTWAVAVVCFVLLAVSMATEHLIHAVGHWLKKKDKTALYEALEKVKGELMLLGFTSLLLTVFQQPICSNICISEKLAAAWHPCEVPKTTTKTKSDSGDIIHDRKLLQFLEDPSPRRVLATKGYDKCADKGKVAFVSANAIHQLHIFIFVLAIFHVLQCIITLTLARTKMRKWKAWENETKAVEYQLHRDPERCGFAWETAFERRHKNIWTQSPISLWIVCFFRQLIGSVTKADYMALKRHGFFIAHLAPGSQESFDFHEYINTSLDEDFKVVVGISPIIWFTAVLFLLTNTNGWHPYLWFPFIPLIIILLVSAKLQMIITKMALRIQERAAVELGDQRGEVENGAEVVELGGERGEVENGAQVVELGGERGEVENGAEVVELGGEIGEAENGAQMVELGGEIGEVENDAQVVELGGERGEVENGAQAVELGGERGEVGNGAQVVELGGERGEVENGAQVVQPGDHLFWFKSPRFLLFLIHLVLFQNAFGLAFFAWSTYEFSIHSCFHRGTADIVIRLTMGVVIQFLCSYVTLPLYALVTQMRTSMNPAIFNERGIRVEEVRRPLSMKPITMSAPIT